MPAFDPGWDPTPTSPIFTMCDHCHQNILVIFPNGPAEPVFIEHTRDLPSGGFGICPGSGEAP